jgi:hypothetical protein
MIQWLLLMFVAVAGLMCVPARAQDAQGATVRDNGTLLVIRDHQVALALSKAENYAVVSLTDVATGRELAANAREPRLFQLVFSTKGDISDKRLYVSNREAESVVCQVESEGKTSAARLHFDNLAGRGIQVACTASVTAADPLVRWRLAASYPDDLMLEAVQFPIVVLRTPLGGGTGDAVVLGLTKGGVYHRPAEWKVGTSVDGRQPGSLAAQFACYYDEDVGFFTACEDSVGYPKTCHARRTEDGLSIVWEQHCFAERTFSLDYDVVLTTFRGADPSLPTDWRDAADIYKRWAVEQPWCARTYLRRPDIPDWLKSGPAMVRFTRSWLADTKLIENWLNLYWRRFFQEGLPLIVAYWGWEKVSSWVTPDYFPVYPSDEEFRRLTAATAKLSCHTFPWPSGYHYTLTYGQREDGTFEWDDRERFERVFAPHAVHRRDGSVWREKRSWLRGGETSAMCPGDPWTIDWFNEIAVELCKRGADMIQVDQVVGGAFPWCYSDAHGHPPGPGPWMTHVFRRQLETALQACRRIQPQAVLCFEEPNELFIQQVAIQDYRDIETLWRDYPPSTPASVFNYLYHEYLPTFQSNPRQHDKFIHAYCLVNGQIPHLIPSEVIGPGPLLVNGGFETWAGNVPSGWEKVSGWQGKEYTGRCTQDTTEWHSGASSLHLENSEAGQVVQVSQNVWVGKPFKIGGTYRLSAWMKTRSLAQPNAILLATLTQALKSTGGWRINMPDRSSDWTRGEVTFTVPEGSDFLRIMIHLQGQGEVWVDDLTLEEMRSDGTFRVLMRPETPPDHDLMSQWVKLFYGEGRPYLLHGRMLHPPKLETGMTQYAGRELPAVLHNAYRAPDGSEAVIVVNATGEQQKAELSWKGKMTTLLLAAWEVRLLRDRDVAGQ